VLLQNARQMNGEAVGGNIPLPFSQIPESLIDQGTIVS
jgi:hypothetical protein